MTGNDSIRDICAQELAQIHDDLVARRFLTKLENREQLEGTGNY